MFTHNEISLHDKDAAIRFSQSLHYDKFALINMELFTPEDLAVFYSSWDVFFNSETKNDYLFEAVSQQGYFPIDLERARTAKKTDHKEMFHYIPTGNNPVNVRQPSYKIYIMLLLVSQTIMHWLDIGTPEAITEKFPIPLSSALDIHLHTLLRVLYYPETHLATDDKIRAAEHEDISLVTLLPLATSPGLEIKNASGEWVAVQGSENSILVIVGDLLESYSHNYYQSTAHRVVHPEGVTQAPKRLSTVLFVHPKPDIMLPNGYTVQGFFNERIKQIGLYQEEQGKEKSEQLTIY